MHCPHWIQYNAPITYTRRQPVAVRISPLLMCCWWGFKVFLRVFVNLAGRILAEALDASYKMCTTLCPCGCTNSNSNFGTINVQQCASDNVKTGEFSTLLRWVYRRQHVIRWAELCFRPFASILTGDWFFLFAECLVGFDSQYSMNINEEEWYCRWISITLHVLTIWINYFLEY